MFVDVWYSLHKICVNTRLVSVFIFNPFFNHFYCPTHPTVPTLSLCLPTLSLCLPMLPYTISTILMFFPMMWIPTLLSLSLSSRPFTRYQEQGLLVVDFGLLRAISTISTIPTMSRTGIFHILFVLFSQHSHSLSFKVSSYQTAHTRSELFRLLTLFTDNQNTLYWTHYVADRHANTTTGNCQGHSSLTPLVSWILPQKIPSLFKTPLVPQAEG